MSGERLLEKEQRIVEVGSTLLAHFRALYDHYRHAHWCSSGEVAYQDHLLYERFYDSLKEEIDGLAEKFVGRLGEGVVSPVRQQKIRAELTKRWARRRPDDLLARSLHAERSLLYGLERTYETFDRCGRLSMGMDDMLMSLYSDHETHLYLLKQRDASRSSCHCGCGCDCN